MLNMIDTQDKLKNFSEDQLIKEMQMPSGSAPQFMVLGEIERRKRMRQDAQRQEGLMQPTVAQEAVNGAGVPQKGLAGIAQSLAPKTDMTQNTGVPNAQASNLPAQPNQPQRMADGGVLRLAPGGSMSGGTLSAIANLKVMRPDLYEEYKDDPEMLELAAEFLLTSAKDSEMTGLESLAAEQAATPKPVAFVGGLPFYLSKDGQSIVDGEGRAVTENSILNSIAQSMAAQAEARGSKSPTNVFDSPQGIASAGAGASDFVPSSAFDATQSYSSAPQMDVREPLASEIDRFTTNLQGVFQPRYPGDTPQQQALVAADQGDGSGVVLESGPLIQESDGGEYGIAGLTRRRAEQERRNEERLAAQAAMPEDLIYGGEPVLTQPEPDETGYVARNPYDTPYQQAQVAKDQGGGDGGDGGDGGYIPTNIRPTELNTPAMRNALSTDSGAGLATGLRNAAEASQDGRETSSFMDMFDTLKNAEASTFRDVLNKYRVPDPETQSVNNQEEIARINIEIAEAEAAGNSNLVITLDTRRKQLLMQENLSEAAKDVGEVFNPGISNFVREQYSTRVAPFITSPQEAAVSLDTLAAERVKANAAEREREARIKLLEGGATTVPTAANTGIASINDAARMKEINKIPGQGVKTAAQQEKIGAALKTVTDPAAMPPAVKPDTGTGGTGTGKKSGIVAAKNQMDQDKWLALAQAGFTLMSTGDFGKAGSAGLASLRESKKGDREERKLEAELMLRDVQMAAANRKGTTKPPTVAAAALNNADSRVQSAREALAEAKTPADKLAADKALEDALYYQNELTQRYAASLGITPRAGGDGGPSRVTGASVKT